MKREGSEERGRTMGRKGEEKREEWESTEEESVLRLIGGGKKSERVEWGN